MTSADEFLTHLFEHEYCCECGGDAEHHEVLSDFPFPGTHFARCRFTPGDDGEPHPVIAAFRAGNKTEVVPVSDSP